MAKYKPKTEVVDAIQFTGTNTSDVLMMVGFRNLDLKGDYDIPNFVVASDWVYGAASGDWAVWSQNDWKIVPKNCWVVKSGMNISVFDDFSFKARYEAS